MTTPTRLIPPNLWVAVPELGCDVRVEADGPTWLRFRRTHPHAAAVAAAVPPRPASSCGHRRQPGTWL